MSTTQNTKAAATISWTRRLTAGLVLAAAPALIALGAATTCHADTGTDNLGSTMHAPVHHPAFPHQTNVPQPGTSIHHHHQNRRG